MAAEASGVAMGQNRGAPRMQRGVSLPLVGRPTTATFGTYLIKWWVDGGPGLAHPFRIFRYLVGGFFFSTQRGHVRTQASSVLAFVPRAGMELNS